MILIISLSWNVKANGTIQGDSKINSPAPWSTEGRKPSSNSRDYASYLSKTSRERSPLSSSKHSEDTTWIWHSHMRSYVLVECVPQNENNKTKAWILTGSSQPVLMTQIARGTDINVLMLHNTLLSQVSREYRCVWNITQCSITATYQRFDASCYLHLQVTRYRNIWVHAHRTESSYTKQRASDIWRPSHELCTRRERLNSYAYSAPVHGLLYYPVYR